MSVFGDVREGEGGTALLLMLNVFLLLMAYYLLKVAREPLILTDGGGAAIKSYASVGQSLLLIPAVAGYDWLAGKVGRMALAFWVTLFFVGCLVAFFLLGEAGAPVSIPFFLWVGIFNVSAVAQFWSFAADIYPEEAGKRLFPVIGIGSSIGAVAGAWVAELLIAIGPYKLMLLAAALLVGSLGVTFVVNQREGTAKRGTQGAEGGGGGRGNKEAPIGGDSGAKLLLRDRYLLLFAALILVLNVITKTGDYVLDTELIEAAKRAGGDAKAYIGHYKANYFAWVNGAGVVLQLFFVSRIIKHLGMRTALVIMPVVSLIGYGVTFLFPVLGVIFWARVGESSLDYSLSNTTRQTLWLVTSREVKYKVKQVIDSFVVRIGDAGSAGLVWVGVQTHLSLRGFIVANLLLSGLWLVIAIALGRSYYERAQHHPEAAKLA